MTNEICSICGLFEENLIHNIEFNINYHKFVPIEKNETLLIIRDERKSQNQSEICANCGHKKGEHIKVGCLRNFGNISYKKEGNLFCSCKKFKPQTQQTKREEIENV